MKIAETENKINLTPSQDTKIRAYISKVSGIGDVTFSLQTNYVTCIDAYFDTQDFKLAKTGQYLRLRNKNQSHYITYRKVTTPEIDENTFQLNTKAIQFICEDLHASQPELPPTDYSQPTYLGILQSLRLQEVLRVRLDRVEKALSQEELPLGKIKLDRFSYGFEITPEFHELEIVHYDQRLNLLIPRFIETLTKVFGPFDNSCLQPSKYIRGLKQKGLL